MRASETIGFRLTSAFALLFVILIGFGLDGLMHVDDFSKESSAIRERWLKSTRFLGDLNNYTSDFRALEATSLVTASTSDSKDLSRDIQQLDDAIAKAREGYESVGHDRSEMELYSEFQNAWRTYRREAEHVIALRNSRENVEANSVYFFDTSRLAYRAADDLLGRLSDLTNESAQKASERAASTMHAARTYLGAAVILSIVTVGIILFYVMRIVVMPLKDLATCMNELSKGKMDITIPGIDQTNEMGQMGRAVSVFRENAVELRLSQSGLALQASMLEEKLAQEKRLNEQQRNFVSMASHEFRTPMTIIDGHAQRLLNEQESITHEKIAGRADKIRAAIRRMNAMINNMLNSIRLIDEGTNLYLHISEFDLHAALSEVCKVHREISPRLALFENIRPETLLVEGDKELLSQAFNNIIANAIKYSQPGESIFVNCSLDGEQIIVSVIDHGIGIPEADAPHIFERYYRGGNATTVTGTGIGLFLVKVVVDLHGGSVSVVSHEGDGATFVITLPRKQLVVK